MPPEYIKNFDAWNDKKKILEQRNLPDDFFFLEGEIWWAALGINIGHETDGKNEMFERPIVVLKKITDDTLWALPITTVERKGGHFYNIQYKNECRTILLSQIRLMSGKRLLRLIYRLTNEEFEELLRIMSRMLSSIKAKPSG